MRTNDAAITCTLLFRFLTTKWSDQPPNPNQMRWKPFDIPKNDKVDWIDGLHTVAGDLIDTITYDT